MGKKMREATSHDVAKAFGKYQEQALTEGGITVTHYGRPRVVILSHAAYQLLLANQKPRDRKVYRAEDMPDELIETLDETIAKAPDSSGPR